MKPLVNLVKLRVLLQWRLVAAEYVKQALVYFVYVVFCLHLYFRYNNTTFSHLEIYLQCTVKIVILIYWCIFCHFLNFKQVTINHYLTLAGYVHNFMTIFLYFTFIILFYLCILGCVFIIKELSCAVQHLLFVHRLLY